MSRGPFNVQIIFCCSGQCIQKTDCDKKRLNVVSGTLTNLRFAHIILISKDCDDMETMINELNTESLTVGFKINIEMTKIMFYFSYRNKRAKWE